MEWNQFAHKGQFDPKNIRLIAEFDASAEERAALCAQFLWSRSDDKSKVISYFHDSVFTYIYDREPKNEALPYILHILIAKKLHKEGSQYLFNGNKLPVKALRGIAEFFAAHVDVLKNCQWQVHTAGTLTKLAQLFPDGHPVREFYTRQQEAPSEPLRKEIVAYFDSL